MTLEQLRIFVAVAEQEHMTRAAEALHLTQSATSAAIAALEGEVVPQEIKLPLAIASDPDFKEGQDYFPKESDNFFVGNSFPSCGINFTAQEIMDQSKENQ